VSSANSRSARMIERLRARKEEHRKRSKLYRVVSATVGVLLIILGGLLSLPGVPGPGLVVIAIGLALLALEFDRAERLLELALERIDDVTEASPLVKAVLIAVGLAAGVGVAAAFWFWDVPVLPGRMEW
jgi:uncharacterized protein (TIGR02611 family)